MVMDFSTLQCTRLRAFCVYGSVALDFSVALLRMCGGVVLSTEKQNVKENHGSYHLWSPADPIVFPFDVDGIDFTD